MAGMETARSSEARADRGGRPATTSAHELAARAQELFLERGFEKTSVGDIADAAGVSRRTFFRYFPTKADVVWVESAAELDHFRQLVAAAATDAPPHLIVTEAFIASVDHGRAEARWARHRAQLILTVPAVQAQANVVYRQWRTVIADLVRTHSAGRDDDAYPTAVAYAVIAGSSAAHEMWLERDDLELGDCLRRMFELMVPEPPSDR
ncbi:acyl-CoA-like ligand-binding transcription factor [Gordonia sp. KTR9]|uniref:acyl-CoA-like ligand-binding transcription factor n=1 Tax=Gordonia sp. KTR9 TaxID=337191 RepID=UPI00027DDFA3|nr:TetR family transcriptional regulator [Gordonia sp. KTR9]AFR50642.1 Transcriptional regulator [Gordonia sp. KTR9]